MSEEIRYVYATAIAAATWVMRLIWVNHKTVEALRRESPSWAEMKQEIANCSEQKDKDINEMKNEMRDNFKYIRNKVDEINNRELSK